MTNSDDDVAQLLQRHRTMLGRRLRAARRHRDLTQDNLAAKTGCSRPRLSHIEHGRINITLDTLHRLAIALDVSVSALLDDSTDIGQIPSYRLPSSGERTT